MIGGILPTATAATGRRRALGLDDLSLGRSGNRPRSAAATIIRSVASSGAAGAAEPPGSRRSRS